MALDILHKIVYSLISGFTEFIFTSTFSHQFLYGIITGNRGADPILDFVIHLGCLAALFCSCSKYLKMLRHEKKLQKPVRHQRERRSDPAVLMDMRIINTAAIAGGIGYILFKNVGVSMRGAGLMGIFLIVNGLIMFIPRIISIGNKNGNTFTLFDGMLMGLASILGSLPGISRLGCMYSAGLMRGADKNYALNLCLMVSFTVLAVAAIFDIYAITISGLSLTFIGFLSYVLAAAASFAGAYLSVMIVRHVIEQVDTSAFAYYNWGLAIFVLLIALLTP